MCLSVIYVHNDVCATLTLSPYNARISEMIAVVKKIEGHRILTRKVGQSVTATRGHVPVGGIYRLHDCVGVTLILDGAKAFDDVKLLANAAVRTTVKG